MCRYLKFFDEDRRTERNKKNEGQNSGYNKRKMARVEDEWTIAT